MTPDIQDDDPAEEELPAGPEEDEVPPARFVKIEDYAGSLASLDDVRSPHESLNGGTLATPKAVAAARVSAEGEDGVLIGATIAELAYVIGELGGRQGVVLLDRLAMNNSFTVGFKTGAESEPETLEGPTSREQRGARLLMLVLSSRSTDELLRALGTKGRAVAPRLEALLKLLFEYRATLDLQTPRERPIRVTSERAAALYNALREPYQLPNETFVGQGQLTGAYFDTRDFKLRLNESWRGRRVIEGKFREGLEQKVQQFLNGEVLADVSVKERGKGAHGSRPTYTLEDLREPPRLRPA